MVAPCTDVAGTVEVRFSKKCTGGLMLTSASRCVRGGLSGFGLHVPKPPLLVDKVYCNWPH